MSSATLPPVSPASVARREFLKTLGNGAVVTLSLGAVPSSVSQAASSARGLPAADMPGWAPVPGVARQRIDGLPKVLGEKIFARDFAARDFKHWPQDAEYFAYALRCARVDAVLLAYDLSPLPPALRPLLVIDAAALQQRAMPERSNGMNAPFFARPGAAPDYYGQPAAILIFKDFNTYRRAYKFLQFHPDLLRWGEAAPPVQADYAPATHVVRDDRQGFSFFQTSAADYQSRQKAVAQEVRSALDEAGLLRFSRNFSTQALDPMFMEPENGLAWYDAERGVLQMVVGTQSPGVDIADCATVYDCGSLRLKKIEFTTCPPGGGFGGRDASFFSPYLAMVAAFCDRPVRWRFDRYEQFQVGLKRCPTAFSATLALQADGRLRGVLADYVFDSGGERNYSAYVANLAALSSMSCYEIPLAAVSAKAIKTRHILGGSHRGFGGPQAYLAIETLLDEAAAALKMDPFALRRKNLLQRETGRTISGAPVQQDLQLVEIMDHLERHPLWTQRARVQAKKARQGLRYGVGFAMSNQAYGTSMDGMFGAVELDADGEVVVHTAYVDMGNGAATTLGLAPAWGLGRNAARMAMGELALFNNLGLHSPGRFAGPNSQSCKSDGFPARTGEPPASTDPLDKVLRYAGPSAACLGAFHNFHVVQYAARALFLHSVLPAARRLWGQAVEDKACFWRDGRLHAPGLPALSMKQIRLAMQDAALPAFCVAHATFSMRFAQAEFAFNSGTVDMPLDWLGFGADGNSIRRLDRANLRNPPENAARCGRSVYAPCGCLVGLSVNPKNGEIKVEEVVTAISAGRLLSPEIVSGQYQGGVMMALGSMLFEHAPDNADGPGNGTWNLHRYRVPRMQDVPKMELIPLAAPANDNTARAIGEAVFCPTGPALMNALAMACGKRFAVTPLSAQQILESLQ